MTELRLELDHVGVVISELERGRRDFARLGFHLTPRSDHAGARVAGGPVEPWGSGNHCAMLRDGYLEVMGITDPGKYSSALDMVAKYQGLHIIALGCANADEAYAAIRARGGQVEAPHALERDAAFGPDGREKRRAAFRNIYVDRARVTEARFIIIEHRTRDVLWQPHLLEHPNGALAMRDAFLCVPDPAATATKFGPLFGSDWRQHEAGCLRLALARGALWLMSEGAWQRWAPGAALPMPGSPVGFGVRVRDLAATRRLLVTNGVIVQDGRDGGIWVGPQQACGAVVYFFGSSSA
jgi:hypothetical protein